MRLTFLPRILSRAVPAFVLTAAMGPADASGFQIRKLSAAASGNAMAGATAGAGNIGYMAFNPAAIGRWGYPGSGQPQRDPGPVRGPQRPGQELPGPLT